jgi:hypothetical protein
MITGTVPVDEAPVTVQARFVPAEVHPGGFSHGTARRKRIGDNDDDRL